MTNKVQPSTEAGVAQDALRTLLAAGFVPMRLEPDGRAIWPQSTAQSESLRIELFKRSPMVAKRLDAARRRWSSSVEIESEEIFEGLWAIPLRAEAGGGWLAALAISETFLREDRLDAICATAGADRRAMEMLIRRGGLVAEDDLPRQETLLRNLWNCLERAFSLSPRADQARPVGPRGAASGAVTVDAPIEALVGGIDRRDPTNRGHSRRVALLCRLLAEAIGCDAEEVRTAELAGLVHDVGKVALPGRILRKPGPLDRREYAQVRKHPQIGCRLLRGWLGMRNVLDAVRHHHERWDGLGYPKGIRGERIPKLARIIAIADAYDAMTSDRPYRAAMSREQAFVELKRCAGTHFDPELVPVFLGLDLTEYERRRGCEERQTSARSAA
jgi:HD-GYP domain-containing protein (c-di-GMP phosphodiesterase class II)